MKRLIVNNVSIQDTNERSHLTLFECKETKKIYFEFKRIKQIPYLFDTSALTQTKCFTNT